MKAGKFAKLSQILLFYAGNELYINHLMHYFWIFDFAFGKKIVLRSFIFQYLFILTGIVFLVLSIIDHLCIKIQKMVVLQYPDVISFTSNIKDIIIQSNENITAKYRQVLSGIEFLTETFSPDSEGKIYIRGLGALFLSYLSPSLLVDRFLVECTSTSGETISFPVLVQYGLAEIDIPAAQFLDCHYLTFLQNEKIIYPFQHEYLSLFLSAATEVSIKARYASGEIASKSLNFQPSLKVLTLDVSPSLFDHPETIHHLVVVAGKRTFTYYIRHPAPIDPVQFVFLNSFGVKETFIPFGIISSENKYENQFGVFNGMYRRYQAELVKEYTAHTGVLTDNMAEWIEDLIISKHIFILNKKEIEKEVTVIDATIQRSFLRDELPAHSFKYRLSKINENGHYIQDCSRIFDSSFDCTFE